MPRAWRGLVVPGLGPNVPRGSLQSELEANQCLDKHQEVIPDRGQPACQWVGGWVAEKANLVIIDSIWIEPKLY